MIAQQDGVAMMEFPVVSMSSKRKLLKIVIGMLSITGLLAAPCLQAQTTLMETTESKVESKTERKTESNFVIVSGSVAYRQRIAMPPDAVLTVKVEDVSRADAPAKVLAETSEAFGARQVPLRFLLKVPSSAIDKRYSYAVRATIKVGNELRFTTTRSYPVLTRGAANQLDLMLDAVPATVPARNADKAVPVPIGNRELQLPASFAGALPCADCRGIAQTLSLRADGLYRLRRTYLGKDAAAVSELGHWSLDASGKQLTLSSPNSRIQMALLDDGHLRLLDQQGTAIKTSANLDLRRTAKFDAVNETLRWRGEFVYMADAASFTDCASGIRWPVVVSADSLNVERQYRQAARPMLIQFDGRLAVMSAMEGAPREQMLIQRLEKIEPGMSCLPHQSVIAEGEHIPEIKNGDTQPAASLSETYWKLSELNGVKIVMPVSQTREVRITLRADGRSVTGFAGCNQLTGSYQQAGSALRFSHMASTRMACSLPSMELENKVLSMLDAVSAYRINGDQLLLLKGDQLVARFEAVYLH